MNRAVIIGIDGYPGAPLGGCVNDANEIAALLSLEQFDFDSVLLLDRQATRSNILRELNRIAHADSPHGKGSVFLVYFAGHGQVVGRAGHLVTYDAMDFDPGISLAQLAQVMESASVVFDHVISILDCCHSGSAFTWASSRPLDAADVEREVQTVNESRCVLAACRPEELADETDEHGAFTAELIDAMLGAAVNWDGDITLMGVYEYIASVMPQGMQTPVFKGDIAGTVVIGRGFEARKGPPIEKNELNRTIAKAQQLVDGYYYLQQRELTDRGQRLARGAKACAAELEGVVNWFDDTERDLPDVRRHPLWESLTRRLLEFRKNLSEVSPGEETHFGTITRHIGHGGFGHVWEVENDSGQTYALKIFHGNELDVSLKVQRFANGYNNMRKLQHPHIVRVHDMTKAPYGFIMDAIQGENLRNTYLEREGNAEVIVRLMIDICETVQHAHAQGVRHRDIKPENIIVAHSADREMEPYLTDFDLAYHETNRTMTANLGVGGVINYAAPEQLYAPNAKSARSETVDVFSLAQLMFFLIVGHDPNPESSLKNRKSLARELSSWIDDRASEQLVLLYTRATNKAPEERPQTVTEFVMTLRRAEAFIQLASASDDIPEQDFWRRVGQAYVGMGKYDATNDQVQMDSMSRQVNIIARFKAVTSHNQAEVEIECSVSQNIPIPAFKSGRSAREAINTRIDKRLLRNYGHSVQRHNGHKGMYQVFITISNVKFHIDGVNHVVEVVTDTVNCIESWG